MRIVVENRPLTNKPTDGGEQAVWGTLERPGEVVDLENHAPIAKDQLSRTDRRPSTSENDMMRMARLLVLAENMHHSKDILHEHIVSGEVVVRESPALSVPTVTRLRITQRSVGGQRHESSFRVRKSIPNH